MFYKNWLVEVLKPAGRLDYEFGHPTQARFLPDGVNRKSSVAPVQKARSIAETARIPNAQCLVCRWA
ncbi:MAG: hypothetical protein DME26_16985 [Verrucomicrobia bacterium]|nr:MAG: hypothetical protein DME26_16985 [Verrucomicrobiota bacterium]